MALVAEGKTNKEIACSLHLTEGTIKEYTQWIFKKTGVRNRTELAMWSMRLSWRTAEPDAPSGAARSVLRH